MRFNPIEPRPAAVAYANIVRWLEDATFVGQYPTGGAGEGWVFHRGDEAKPVLAAWVKTGRITEQWPVPSGARSVTVTDLFGNAHEHSVENGKLQITLTDSPVFITGLTRDDLDQRLQTIEVQNSRWPDRYRLGRVPASSRTPVDRCKPASVRSHQGAAGS
jgi:hypothetical protein